MQTETRAPAINKRTFIGISSFQVLAMFRRGLFYSYLSIYLRFFLGLSVTETTFFATFPMILNIVFQTFVWGGISDRYQRRKTLIILGEIFAAISTFFVWFAHTIPKSTYTAGYVVIIGLSLVEVFWSMSNVGWTALISDLYPEYERANIQGKLASVGAVGRIAGVWIGGLAYDGLSRFYEGWGFHQGLLFFIASGIMLVSIIPMLFVPEGGTGIPHSTHERKRFQMFGVLTSCSKQFLIFLLAMVFINFGRNSIVLIKTQYLVLDEGFNVSSSLLSYIVNMQSIAILCVGLFIGRLTKQWRDETLLNIGALAAIIHLFGFIFARSLPVIFVSNFLAGSSQVITLAASYAIASRLIPAEERAKQFALFNATLYLSWGIGATFIAGPIVDILLRMGIDQTLSYKMSFVSAIVLVVVGVIILRFVKRPDSCSVEKIPQPHHQA
ncbi:MAG: MFS transporter [candidate division WOR-3 bacterium]|nr:MAG: MFS transporter [candidate division WOR-3 bacterium]